MLTQSAAKDNLEQIINAPLYELNPDFWEEIREPYERELQSLSQNCIEVLRSSFHCEREELKEFMESLQQTLHQFTVDYVRRIFRDINTSLLRKFNKLFKKDDTGTKNREWRDIEEGKIRDIWSKCRATMLDVINDFKYIRLPKKTLTETLDESCKKMYTFKLNY